MNDNINDLNRNAELHRISEELHISNMTPEEREAYDKQQKWIKEHPFKYGVITLVAIVISVVVCKFALIPFLLWISSLMF